MLNQKICIVDVSEHSYGLNSIYTQTLPRPQLNVLYLASALALRNNSVTILCERDDVSEAPGLRFAPLPMDPETFWGEADYDLVICLNSLDGASSIRPYLKAATPMVLWSQLPPRHVAMMPLQHDAVREAWTSFVFDSTYLTKCYQELYGLSQARCNYRWPAIVRTLRKRFTSSDQLAKLHAGPLTIAYCAHPGHGLGQVLDLFEKLKGDLPELRFKLFLNADYDPDLASESHQEQIARCRALPDVDVYDPEPWPSFVEKLLSCHVVCHPLAFMDLGLAELIDPLAAGCLTVLCKHTGLHEICQEHPVWVDPDPVEDFFERYYTAVRELLEEFKQTPDEMLRRSFSQIARFNTHFTWDLRVWEWESLFFKLVEDPPPALLDKPASAAIQPTAPELSSAPAED